MEQRPQLILQHIIHIFPLLRRLDNAACSVGPRGLIQERQWSRGWCELSDSSVSFVPDDVVGFFIDYRFQEWYHPFDVEVVAVDCRIKF